MSSDLNCTEMDEDFGRVVDNWKEKREDRGEEEEEEEGEGKGVE